MSGLIADLRLAVRGLRRQPAFTAAAILILAVGIGVNSAVFSVVNAVLISPLPVADPQELVRIYSAVPDDFMALAPMAEADVEDLRRAGRSFSAVAASSYTPLALEHRGAARLVMGELVSDDYFGVLGVRPLIGRGFVPRDAADGTEAVVMLSHSAWQNRFGADPGVVGESLRLNGRPHTVIGVAPASFFGITRGVVPELWLPATGADDAAVASAAGRRDRGLWVVARLASGVSVRQAAAEVEAIAARLQRAFPDTNGTRSFVVVPASQVRVLPAADTAIRGVSVVALGLVALVLLIATANVASLLLARSFGRRAEIAIRVALGARRIVVMRQLLTEGLLLALMGGVLGLVVAVATNIALTRLRFPLPVDIALGLTIDIRVVAFTAAVSLLATVGSGLMPALAGSRVDLVAQLQQRAAMGGDSSRGLQDLLVTIQVAVSVVLLVCTGLAVRSMLTVDPEDLGFEADGVVVATVAPQLQGYAPAARATLFDRIGDAVRALPAVRSAGWASHLPLSFETALARVAPPGDVGAPPESWRTVDAARVGPGYFRTMHVPQVGGRGFTATDTNDAPPVVVVNEALAAQLWPQRDPVGQRLVVDGVAAAAEVVGVVATGKYRTLGEAPRPFLYRPRAQAAGGIGSAAGAITTGTSTLVVRVTGEPRAALAEIRETVRRLDSSLAVTRLATLEESLGPSLGLPAVASGLLAIFSGVGLLLAASGIYGMMAYGVGRRRRELGIRAALGAPHAEVMALVSRGALRVTGAGLLLGLAASTVVTRALSSVLYGVTPIDPLVFAGVSLLLALVALGAGFIPARRATQVDPAVVLRS